MVAEAVAARPRECCGLLVGLGNRVHFAVPVRNRAAGVSRYIIDPTAHLELQRTLRRFKPSLAVVGAYHSHPRGRARLSQRDIEEATDDPEWIHLIVGLSGRRAETGAFRVQAGQVVPVSLHWT